MAEQRVQRRLAAILIADMVGYSRMMERDEAGTLARLKAHRRELIDPSIRAHGGRVVRSTGDGVLVEFPSAAEAVFCAVEIQRAMIDRSAREPEGKHTVFRIGISIGDLIIDAGDIFGNGVNLSARLESLSPPGGLCISRAVRDQVRDRVPYCFEDRGEHCVKNMARPVRVYALDPDVIAGLPAAESPALEHSARWSAPRVVASALATSALLALGGVLWLLASF